MPASYEANVGGIYMRVVIPRYLRFWIDGALEDDVASVVVDRSSAGPVEVAPCGSSDPQSAKEL